MGDYKIGTSHAGLAAFSALTVPMADPRGEAMDYARYTELGNGSKLGTGWIQQTWHWGFMSEAQRNQLFNYVGVVYIYARKNSGSFGYFTGVLVWPEAEPEHYANRVIDITVEIRKLVEYTP